MSEDFSQYPVSIAELRSDRTKHAADWSPRDLLIALLREIDQGKHPNLDTMIVVFSEHTDDGSASTKYRISSANPYKTFGLLGLAQQHIFQDGQKVR